MIERKLYLSKLIALKNNGFPKVITGIRRCGKSYLLKEIYKNYLIENGVSERNIIIVELDDLRNIKYRNPIELDKYIREKCDKSCVNYIFIDEIQLVDPIVNPIYTKGEYIIAKKDNNNIISFVEVVLGLSREKYIDLYVTGSNSKMLSSDIITEFRDKAINITLGPLSFEEFCNFKKNSSSDTVFEYMQYSGMPLAVLKNANEKKEYLKNLFETTYFKDILEHNNLTKTELLDSLCNIISEWTGNLFNSEKIVNTYKSITKEKIDKDTVKKYIDFFIDSFILKEASRYDIKGKREIGALRKYYFVDNGLRNARLNFTYEDEGQMLENLIYNELIYNGYTVNIGTFGKKEKNEAGKSISKIYEIDFIATKGPKKYYIQVSNDISNPEIKARELKPFLAHKDHIQKILVINKTLEETTDNNGFTIIGVSDFLLKFIKWN
ncbi:ATP-binding protein [Metamycoplasma hyosynoviae]|nr:ATP-binding protein [Metamycoplasma hyosynoviae]MDC8913623.1 ATP-binding protein [Metamycoplasma hyosynoviae]